MPKQKPSRKQLFRAALALAGIDAEQFAAQAGVTGGHVSQVLDGKRESKTLTDKVDAFVEKHLGDRYNALTV